MKKKKIALSIASLLIISGFAYVATNYATYKPDELQPDSFKTWTLEEKNNVLMAIMNDARWAQNAHNLQSWKLKPLNGDSCAIYLDTNRLLPETDPYHRQLTMSVGSFIGAAEVAANARGYSVTYKYLPEGTFNPKAPDQYPLATISIAKQQNQKASTSQSSEIPVDALSSATVKYRTKPLSLPEEWYKNQEQKWSDEQIKFRWIRNTNEVNALKPIIKKAFTIEMKLPQTRDESINYTQIGNEKRNENPFGITLFGNFSKAQWPMMETVTKLFPQNSQQYADTSIDMFNKAIDKENAILVVTTAENTPELQMEAGRRLELAWLETYMIKGRLLPLSQGLQEYPEMKSIYQKLHKTLSKDGETIQMMASLGQPDGEFYRSPRIQTKHLISK